MAVVTWRNKVERQRAMCFKHLRKLDFARGDVFFGFSGCPGPPHPHLPQAHQQWRQQQQPQQIKRPFNRNHNEKEEEEETTTQPRKRRRERRHHQQQQQHHHHHHHHHQQQQQQQHPKHSSPFHKWRSRTCHLYHGYFRYLKKFGIQPTSFCYVTIQVALPEGKSKTDSPRCHDLLKDYSDWCICGTVWCIEKNGYCTRNKLILSFLP